MSFLKNNIKLFIGIIIGLIISGISVYALNIASKNVSYDNTNSDSEKNNVQDAVDDLYERIGNAPDVNLLFSTTALGPNIATTYTFNQKVKIGLVVINSSQNVVISDINVAQIQSLSQGTYTELDHKTVSYKEGTSCDRSMSQRGRLYLITDVPSGAVLTTRTRYASIIQVIKIK